jgi:hypothetical protein
VLPEAFAASTSRVSRSDMDAMRTPLRSVECVRP